MRGCVPLSAFHRPDHERGLQSQFLHSSAKSGVDLFGTVAADGAIVSP
jgi:hypothetical protein